MIKIYIGLGQDSYFAYLDNVRQKRRDNLILTIT